MEQNMIVVKFKNQTVLKGKTNDFFPNRNRFHLEKMDGSISDVVVEDLKAIFFVKDLEGNKNHKDSYNDVISNAGRKTKVKFLDGEIIYGYTLGYSPERQGFYLTPADLGGNNDRIFIVLSATQNVQFVS
ncbi:MAG: hypothetical protein PVH87_16725 [Desulfobacteraceae bacterium]|jgi:hypothetical protein